MNRWMNAALRCLGTEAIILMLWWLGPIRGGADVQTTLATFLMVHAVPITVGAERLVGHWRSRPQA